MLIITRKQGESFLIGDNVEISIVEINGDKVRVAIDAPREVAVLRKELIEAAKSNKEAAESQVADGALDISGIKSLIKK